ncbi:cytochrome b/b6 domain-containing protein [Alteromonas sp. P256]|uniref:cytochrome b/b6 domain-containing protein n=1 Tax=Alteromonas sp. P256 TaxID=3117399 RepID=UPI002FE341B8
MTERTTQPVKDTPPTNNHRSNHYPRNNNHSNSLQDISIWDGVVRLCHWGLVICFITNYFIVEPGRLYHEIAGYSAVFFIVVRIIWGFTRPSVESTYQDRHVSHAFYDRDISHDCHNTFYDRHSSDVYDRHNSNTFCDRHSSAFYDRHISNTDNQGVCESNYASFRTVNLSSQAFKEHLQHLKLRNVPVQTGHNPFGWLMIFAVIGLFFGLGITGFLMEEVDVLFGNSTLEWVHSIFADVLYACVLIHIAAVFFVQYRGRVQLLRPMITGLRRNLSRDDKS